MLEILSSAWTALGILLGLIFLMTLVGVFFVLWVEFVGDILYDLIEKVKAKRSG